MFKAIRNNKVEPIKEEKYIKVILNDKCNKCGSIDLLAITNDGGSLSTCMKCGKNLILFKYVKDETIKKDTYNNFISNSNIKNSVI